MVVASKEVEPAKDSSQVVKRTAGTSIVNVLYTFVKRFGAFAAVYCLGYFDFSIAWLIGPVVLAVVREEWKKEHEMRRNIAKAAALCNEREVILARVDDLPSWVYFPDVERVEWVNRIIRQVWPNVNHFAKALLKDTIEPRVRDSLAEYNLNGFRFEKMVLGGIPLRVGGVKVYDLDVHRKEIMMDMDLFYAGDCDISFSLCGIKGGIKDFQIHGMMRVVMKPLIREMPLVGGLQVFFLNNPTIDFNLVGVADLLDMPGLSDILRRTIVEIIAGIMVLPNKLPIQLSDMVAAKTLKTPEPEGVLRMHVVEAKDLMKKDISMLGKGKSDPYTIINVGAEEFRTHTINNTVNPKWNYWCEATIHSRKSQEVLFELWDWDPGFPGVLNDDFLGRATVEVSTIAAKGEADLWLTLDGAKHGMVHVRFTWLTLTSDKSALKAALAETQMLRLTSMSTAVLTVYIDSAKNLPGTKSSSKPDSYIVLSLGNKKQQTSMQFRNADPVFEQGFTFLVANPESDTLDMRVMDQKTGSELGQLVYNMTSLLQKEDMQVESQPFPLTRAGPDTKVLLSMQLKILEVHHPPTDEQETPTDEVENEEIPVANEETQPLVRDGSVRRPETPSKSESSPIKKQPSKESIQSTQSMRSTARQPTVEDMMIQSMAPSAVESAPPGDNSDLRNRAPSITSSAGEAGLGRIQLTLRYSVQTQKLIIIVHQVANLPLKDPSNIPDPYVKLYLLPDRSRDSKRKTEVIKDNCNPVYDERFEYVISQAELNTSQLEVSVVTKKSWLSSQSPIMGQIIINLAEVGLPKASTLWFDLLPEVPRDS
ncbi:extended synaptotagmin-2 isoform X2 [Anabrus simplex]|uniref:extended synaptotagmin-2 isoform X2 n=1 Tax=Anabrus simplex TaxID=316456 RepID=UPI0035A34530